MKPGIYEEVINALINEEISGSGIDRKDFEIRKTEKAETPFILSAYMRFILEKAFERLDERSKQIELVNGILALIEKATEDKDFSEYTLPEDIEELLSFPEKNKPKKPIPRPQSSLKTSTLFTGQPLEPQLYSELKKEIQSSDQIDFLVSFIKWTGLLKILPELKTFTEKGGHLRVLTTTYMSATDHRAVDELSKLPNTEIKVNYNENHDRLHAKSYIFHRDTGFSSVYVGSSNLSKAALTTGLEWNIKISSKDQEAIYEKVCATFETYWNSKNFELYSPEQSERLKKALKSKENSLPAYRLEISPYGFQQEILDKLEVERGLFDRHKNLIVAATGTGKTVITALDYKRFVEQNPGKPNRLLFIAHRSEILEQSLETFREVLRDPNFGTILDSFHPGDVEDHLFLSVRSFESKKLEEVTDPSYYDYIVIDEFHHAAANSYQKILDYYKPTELIGLTATPERLDGKDVTQFFDGHIAAEIRLPEAIERGLLVPFQYFGVTDTVDLKDIHWKNGGYDVSELTQVYTADQVSAYKRAGLIVDSLKKYLSDVYEARGLGFCVSVEHANFMADFFNKAGILSESVTGQSSDEQRKSAKDRLKNKEINFIFTVDLYNEGVDIPEIDTVLFLRPTESLTVFLQQLGRGLRLSKDKECLTVLDFIGQAHKKYRFEEKFRSLLKNTRNCLKKEIEDGFIHVPNGCYIELEKVAQEYVLENIKNAILSKKALTAKFLDLGELPTLENFLRTYDLEPRQLYKYATLTDLRINRDINKSARSGLYRLSQSDSFEFLSFVKKALNGKIEDSIKERRLLRMLLSAYFGTYDKTWNLFEKLDEIVESEYKDEILELVEYKLSLTDYFEKNNGFDSEIPLKIHSTYSRDQILLAFDYLTPSNVREGVKYLEDKKTDILFVTLNKTDKEFSPTTLYDDYSVNSELFHWQSQNKTSAESSVGQRYINHDRNGSRVLLFVRESKKDRYGATEFYKFLGPVHYVSHEGSKPMSILWRLEEPVPSRLINRTQKLLAV